MKKQILAFMIASAGLSLHAEITETATDAVQNMGVGWNLGNTLDASGHEAADPDDDAYWGRQGLDSETMWGQPVTSAPLFEMMRNAGFGSIRVPVTWFNHMDKEGNVDPAWMNRVHEVVDYVIDNGLYCILNVHHDTGADVSGFKSWLKADESWFEQNQARYENLWHQIAEEFKDYGEKLLFESYNEMLDVKNSWCFASFSCPGNYDAAVAASAYNGINSYAQSFVNTVRATGSNNATRNLVVNTYSAANGYGTWSQHLKEPITEMALPADVVEGHLIFEVHAYPTIANSNGSNRSLQDIKQEVDGMIAGLNTHLVTKGAPVIFGEWGTSNVDSGTGKTDYDVRRELMMQFMTYFVQQTKANGMGTFYWMGMSDGLYRTFPAFSQPDLAECVTKAYHGSDFQGEYPSAGQMAEIVCFEGDKLLGWGNGFNISASVFASLEVQPVLTLTYTQESTGNDDIQLFYGNWASKPSFVVDGQTFDGDFSPSHHYGTPAGTEHVTTMSFSEVVYQQICQHGLIVHGDGIRVTRAVLRDPASAGIRKVQIPKEHVYYNLMGQRVEHPLNGLFINLTY